MSAETEPQDAVRRRRRGGGRAEGPAPAQPASQLRLPFAPLELVSADGLESIHQAALTVLKEIGNRLPARRRARDPERGGCRRRIGLEAGALRAGPGRGARWRRAQGIHPPRAQPRPQSNDRGPACRLRLGRQRAQLLRSSRRAPARKHRRLSQLHSSRADVRTRFTSGAATLSSRSMSTPPSGISTLFSTC